MVFLIVLPLPPAATLFPYTTLFRSDKTGEICIRGPGMFDAYLDPWTPARRILEPDGFRTGDQGSRYASKDRKSTRLNSSHLGISYAVFCLKKKSTYAQLRGYADHVR